jgi:hypothetical protein
MGYKDRPTAGKLDFLPAPWVSARKEVNRADPAPQDLHLLLALRKVINSWPQCRSGRSSMCLWSTPPERTSAANRNAAQVVASGPCGRPGHRGGRGLARSQLSANKNARLSPSASGRLALCLSPPSTSSGRSHLRPEIALWNYEVLSLLDVLGMDSP